MRRRLPNGHAGYGSGIAGGFARMRAVSISLCASVGASSPIVTFRARYEISFPCSDGQSAYRDDAVLFAQEHACLPA